MNLDCSDWEGGSKEVSEREARCHYSTGTVLAFPHCLVCLNVCLRLDTGVATECTPQPSPSTQSLAQFSAFPLVGRWGRSHVVGHVDGVQLVCQEGVSQVHPLLLPPGVDGNHAGVHDDHHANDEVVLLQDHVSDKGHQVQGLLLRAAQLRHHHQQVGPCEYGTEEQERVQSDAFSVTVRLFQQTSSG